MQRVDRFGHVRPQAGAGAGCEAGPFAHGRYVLAGEAAAEDVYPGCVLPVDGGDVAEVRDIGPVVGEDAGDGFVDLGVPDGLGVEDVLDGEVEATVAAEQGAHPEWAFVVLGTEH